MDTDADIVSRIAVPPRAALDAGAVGNLWRLLRAVIVRPWKFREAILLGEVLVALHAMCKGVGRRPGRQFRRFGGMGGIGHCELPGPTALVRQFEIKSHNYSLALSGSTGKVEAVF
jgi:hypothetical protein